MSAPRPLGECTAADLRNLHAMVYGRCRIWHHTLIDNGPQVVWSRWAWWKAMHYAHRGLPSHAGSWGIYAGSGSGGFTGPGDAEITHFWQMPVAPDGAPVGEGIAP